MGSKRRLCGLLVPAGRVISLMARDSTRDKVAFAWIEKRARRRSIPKLRARYTMRRCRTISTTKRNSVPCAGGEFCSMNTTQMAEAYQGLDQKKREQKFIQLLEKVV